MRAGRDPDLEAFRVLLERLADGRPERSLIYSGLRGVGRTVLLLEFETLTRESGWVCNDIEEVGSGDFPQTFAELAYQLLLSMSFARADAAAREQGLRRVEGVLSRHPGWLECEDRR
jgi:hypothetical protein